MCRLLTVDDLKKDLVKLGVMAGDTILVRAGMRSVGKIDGGVSSFVRALLEVVGNEGTVVSLAFTKSSFLRPKIEDRFTLESASISGALPNVMLKYSGACRSRHPTNSYVAIGKHALAITSSHDENSGAYDPVRNIVDLNGKCLLVGCVSSSPGFTTTHLAEADLGLLKRNLISRLIRTYYETDNGETKLFIRKDAGLCSKSYYKFYSLYVRAGILHSGFIGNAYSILCSAKDAYQIDYSTLKANPRFNICGSPDCLICNGGRWDRLWRMPFFVARKLSKKMGFAGRRS